MPRDNSTASASDDFETSEEKSKTIDERAPARPAVDVMPEIGVPGAIKTDIPSPGELALEKEAQAQRSPIVRG